MKDFWIVKCENYYEGPAFDEFYFETLDEATEWVKRERTRRERIIVERKFFTKALEPMIKDADPELERLLAEEEEIERQTRARHHGG